ncbi:MAG: hypothetical protein HY519_01440 [Candidatus Aenigmarchaeota archaeon]|nr:hypothetical protein [Candidatus Aenigmarchaeota archaeon]
MRKSELGISANLKELAQELDLPLLAEDGRIVTLNSELFEPDVGNGKGIVLIEGITPDRERYGQIAARLCDHGFDVLYFRVPGETSVKGWLVSDTPLSNRIAYGYAALRYLTGRCDEVHIAGYSLGGSAGFRIACRSDLPSSISIAGTPASPNHISPVMKYAIKCLAKLKKGYFEDLQRHAIDNDPSRPECPTLIMHQKDGDKLVDAVNAQLIYQGMPNGSSELIYLTGTSGHWPQDSEFYDALADLSAQHFSGTLERFGYPVEMDVLTGRTQKLTSAAP